MAIIAGVTVDFTLSPRVITIPVAESEVTVVDLQDTLLDIEDSIEGMLHAHLRNTSGGEDLGGGISVGFTMELQNAVIAFAPVTTSKSSGTATTANAAGTTLIDSAATFIADGVVAGATVVNITDQSVSSVISTDSETQLTHYALDDGTDNDWDTSDVYKVWNEAQREIAGGNVVAVDSVPVSISPVRPTFGIQVIRTSASSATTQEQADIEFSSFLGGVTVDITTSNTGTTFPTGTPRQAVNNVADALTIASSRGLTRLYIIGNITFTTGDNITNFTVEGESQQKSTITVDSGAVVNGVEFEQCTLQGTLDSNASVRNSTIINLASFEGFLHDCAMEGTITLGGTADTHIVNCHDATAGGGPVSLATIDMGGSGRGLIVRNFSGGMELKNKSGADAVSIGISRGRLVLDSTVTNGEILIRIGAGKLTDNSVGATVKKDEVMSPATIADQVWNEATSGHVTAGSFGKDVGDLRTSQQKEFHANLSADEEVVQGATYRAKLFLLNFETVLTDANTLPTITIYDKDRTVVVNGANMTKLSTGVYEYTTTIGGSAPTGTWETVVAIDLDGSTTINASDYFLVVGSGA